MRIEDLRIEEPVDPPLDDPVDRIEGILLGGNPVDAARRARLMLDATPVPTQRVRLLHLIGRCAAASGDTPGAREAWEAAGGAHVSRNWRMRLHRDLALLALAIDDANAALPQLRAFAALDASYGERLDMLRRVDWLLSSRPFTEPLGTDVLNSNRILSEILERQTTLWLSIQDALGCPLHDLPTGELPAFPTRLRVHAGEWFLPDALARLTAIHPSFAALRPSEERQWARIPPLEAPLTHPAWFPEARFASGKMLMHLLRDGDYQSILAISKNPSQPPTQGLIGLAARHLAQGQASMAAPIILDLERQPFRLTGWEHIIPAMTVLLRGHRGPTLARRWLVQVDTLLPSGHWVRNAIADLLAENMNDTIALMYPALVDIYRIAHAELHLDPDAATAWQNLPHDALPTWRDLQTWRLADLVHNGEPPAEDE
jgi:hypothetical protein